MKKVSQLSLYHGK
jgi:hypothetical protein